MEKQSIGKDVEKREPCILHSVQYTATIENSIKISQKIQNIIALWSCHPIGY